MYPEVNDLADLIDNKNKLTQTTSNATESYVDPDITAAESPQPSWGDIFGAAFKEKNDVVNIYNRNNTEAGKAMRPHDGPVITKDIFKEIPAEFKGTDYVKAYAFARTPEDIQAITERIKETIINQQTVADAGLAGLVATVAAGIASPTILIPGVGALKGLSTGARVAKGIITGAALTGTAVGIQEAAIHSNQPWRTTEESLTNILASSILGGALGGAVGGLSRGVRQAHTDHIASVLNKTDAPVVSREGDTISVHYGNSSVGAAQVDFYKLAEDNSLARISPGFVRGITGTEGIRSPSLRGILSDVPEVKMMTQRLFDQSFVLGKNLKGEASYTSAETLMKLDEAQLYSFNRAVREIYVNYSGVKTDIGALVQDIKGGHYSLEYLSKRAAIAARNGDIDEALPAAEALAKTSRKLIDKATKQLQDLDILSKELDLKTSTSYLTRVWNKQAVRQNPEGLRSILETSYRKAHPNITDRNVILTDVDKFIKTVTTGVDEDELSINLLLKDYLNPDAAPGITKDRVDWIMDNDVQDYLVNDIVGITNAYVRQASAYARVTEALRDMGYTSVAALRQGILDGAERLAKAASTPMKAAKIRDKGAKDAQFMIEAINGLLGRYGDKTNFDNALSYIRKYNVTTDMGSVAISSFTDITTSLFRSGPFKSAEAWKNLVIHNQAWTKSVDELKIFGVGMQREANTMLRILSGDDNPGGILPGIVQKYASAFSTTFFRHTGMPYLNDFNKRMVGHIVSNRTLKRLQKWESTGKMSDANMRDFARYGISESDYKGLMEQFKKSTVTEDGVHIVQYEKWDNPELLEKWGAALVKEIDDTIVTAGKGDIPLAMQKYGAVKTILQYSNYAIAATNKITIQGIQSRDANWLSGLVAMAIVGAGIDQAYTLLNKKEPETNPAKLLGKGIMRTGAIGFLTTKALGVLAPHSSGRFADRSFAGHLGGPTVGKAFALNDIYAGTVLGDESKDVAGTAAKLVSYQNFWQIRKIIDRVYEIIYKVYGDDNNQSRENIK